jgi:hypothetical protein
MNNWRMSQDAPLYAMVIIVAGALAIGLAIWWLS